MTDSTMPLLNAWESSLTEAGTTAVTGRRYTSAVRAFISWFENQNNEAFDPQRLTPIDLTGYRNQLQQRSASSTVNVHVCALRSFCTWLVDSGKITNNPAQRLKATGVQLPLAPKSLSAPQANALLREAQQTRHAHRDYAILQTLVQTGLRISECAALRLGDVQMSERQGQVFVRAGKGNKARTVPLNASARRALVEYLGSHWGVADEMKAVLDAWTKHQSDESLWYSQKGNKLSIRAMSDVVDQLVATCAHRQLVPMETSAHTLRHTFATNYLRDHPNDLVGLAAILGHGSLETTRIYVQPTAEDLARRMEQTRLNAYQ